MRTAFRSEKRTVCRDDGVEVLQVERDNNNVVRETGDLGSTRADMDLRASGRSVLGG
ncbi:MAG: hypothetical protein SFV23_06580 [Planctomycetaceae bacterium]|nr:hypothetical protein [Planctomycetaceae bacterium]